LRVGLLVDSATTSAWQYAAIKNCADLIDITTVIQCENSRTDKNLLKHWLYYFLNLISIKNSQTKQVPLHQLLSNKFELISFKCQSDGPWQSLDDLTMSKIDQQNLDVIIKIGMNLIRDPQKISSKYGVLSFHHGDPQFFRGRPAGFYELLFGASAVGAVVQQLSNKLDAGTIRAFGRYKIISHSYRKTLEQLFRNSSMLLRLALINCSKGIEIEIVKSGTNYHLPRNSRVLKFGLILTWRKLNRFFFGLFQRRSWKIAELKSINLNSEDQFLDLETNYLLKCPPEISFMADPFLLPGGGIIFEAAKKNSVLGRLMTLKDGCHKIINTSFFGIEKHLSFPFVIQENGKTFVMPEMAEHGSQQLLELDQNQNVTNKHHLLGLEHEKLIDPILLHQDSNWWLFAGRRGTEFDHLFLWSSSNLFGPYKEHQMNPIVIDPSRARNGGAILRIDNELFRVGQNNCREYGDGITVSKITRLDHDDFREEPTTSLKLSGLHGPHTLSTNGEIFYIDCYKTVFDPVAWLARFKHWSSK